MSKFNNEASSKPTNSNLPVPSYVEKHIRGTTYGVISRFNGDNNKDVKSTLLRLISRESDFANPE